MKIKKFKSTEGLEIWVGQDDVSNDYLTLKEAHANDLWFHVSGVSGSHVLLRCGEQNLIPSKESIQLAARLAAYYSQMRHGGKVAVHYCQAKDVHKPRKAKAGTVHIRNFTKIKVFPLNEEELSRLAGSEL